jgi:hypothetical protein
VAGAHLPRALPHSDLRVAYTRREVSI